MSERPAPEMANAGKRPENDQESASKSMAPPAFSLNSSQGEGGGGSKATPGHDTGLGLDKKAGPM